MTNADWIKRIERMVFAKRKPVEPKIKGIPVSKERVVQEIERSVKRGRSQVDEWKSEIERVEDCYLQGFATKEERDRMIALIRRNIRMAERFRQRYSCYPTKEEINISDCSVL